MFSHQQSLITYYSTGISFQTWSICSLKPSQDIVSYLHMFFLLGTLFALGHPDVQLCHRRIVSNQFYIFTTTGISLDSTDSTNTHFFLVCRAYVASRDLWEFLIFQNQSLYKCWVFVVNTVLVIVQLFKWTDGKPGGSPLLLPHVQISHRFWRPILPVYTRHPVGFFPNLGVIIECYYYYCCLWMIFSLHFYSKEFCLTNHLSSSL